MRASDRNQARNELLAVIRSVRRRWRGRHLLTGLAVTGATALVAGLVALAALDRLGEASAAVPWIRAAAGAAVAVSAAWFLGRPLFRRVPDEDVALYLEEHEPSLEAAVLSAIEAREDGAAPAASDALLRRTLETAIRRVHAAEDGRWIERGGLARGAAALLAVVVAGGFLGFIPGAGGRAARLLSSPRPAEAAAGLAVLVEPGNATVSRGADAAIGARLRGFDAALVELAVRTEGDSTFDLLPMAVGRDGGFGYLLFDLEAPTEYYVQAGGVRSPTFVLTVAELPYARRLDLELVFPAYTGLPAQTIPDGGDVAALRGTRVRVEVTPTIPVRGGAIVVDGGSPVRLTPDAETGTLAGEFMVRADGFYHIVLDGPDGAPVEASPRYVVDAMSDGPPLVSVTKPGRDERATAIDEVYVEARGEDDYGIADLTLHWSVNGGEERRESLYGGRGALKEVSAGRTFYLEEYGLEPGDLVAYYVTATDNDAVDGRKRATSDIYFIQIRPFQRNFKAMEQGPPGGQAGEGPDGDLSERQRQIIAATFNLVRDSTWLPPGDVLENLNTLSLAQDRLRQQVDVLAQRMVARQVTRDTAFQKIAEILPRAAAEMAEAAERLRARLPGEALPSEQRALQHLQRAEAVFRDVQVGMGQQAGGGGGGATPNAEDLADLFELELDKLRDQYETVNRGGGGGQDSTAAALDETMERLEELARRQQREAERRRRETMQGTGTAGGAGQRALADEVEEEARRLERLSRERNNPRLEDAARRLQQTAESMRRSAAGGGGEERIVEGLRDARRMLERERGDGLRRRAEAASRRAEEMAREQESIGQSAERLAGGDPGPGREEEARRLEERKEAQLQGLDSVQRELRDLAGQAGSEQPDAARRLRDAATAIDETRLKDKIELSRRIARSGAPEDYARRLEDAIGEDLDELRDRLRGIGDRFESGNDQERAETLDRARDLARGMESLRERTRELREQAPGGESAGEPGGGEPGREAGGGQGEPRAGAPPGGSDGGGGFGAGAVRQYRAEARQRLEDARALRDRLRQEGLPTNELDALLRGIEALTRSGPYSDAEELIRLQEALADQAKRVELLVRVRLAGEAGAALFLDGPGAVPPEYRELVESYYRSLSRDDGGR
ncbi:MAG TPA: hypothetical protein VMM12_16395 [Longimicrobiales bacterium]|nr:hypothetical protein [Longimicrobiales bacterium]